MARKRKNLISDSINGKKLIGPDAVVNVDQTVPGIQTVPQSPVLRKGFNYDEIRRVNVDRVFIAPLANAHRQTNIAAARSPSNFANHTADSNTNPPDSSQHSLVQHKYGETVTGEITELYNTPELKACLDGFYENIPAQFHDESWVKVAYHDDQNYAFAMTKPGLDMQPGDKVRLVFGQQDPPIPNQIMAVLDAHTASHG